MLTQDLANNDGRLKVDYNPLQPVESLFDQIEDVVELANAAQAPYTPAEIIVIAFKLVFRTGLFPVPAATGNAETPMIRLGTSSR